MMMILDVVRIFSYLCHINKTSSLWDSSTKNQRKRTASSAAITSRMPGAHDSHIWDWGAKDKDGDGYRDGSVGDSDLWDD